MSKRTPFVVLCLSLLVSITGNALADLAIPWFVLQTTGSASQTGVAAFFAIVPVVLGTFFGGVIVDRVGYKPISLWSDFLSGGAILLIPLLHFTVGISFWQLIGLVFLGNLFDAPGRTARFSMLPELAEQAGISLERASSIMDMINRGTSFLGAPLAGVLVAWIGAPSVLLLDGITFGISMLGIGLFIPILEQHKTSSNQSIREDFIEGFRFIRQDSLLWVLILTIMVTNMLDGAAFAVVLPVYANEVWGAEHGVSMLGFLLGIWSGTALLGSFLAGQYGGRFKKRPLFILSFMLVSLYFFIFAAYLPYLVLLLALLPSSVAAGQLNPIITAVSYARIPQAMRARVIGFISSGVQVAMPLGVLMAGFLLESFGIRPILIAGGVIYFCMTALLSVYPALHEMDAKPQLSNP